MSGDIFDLRLILMGKCSIICLNHDMSNRYFVDVIYQVEVFFYSWLVESFIMSGFNFVK